jgi:transglutaminase-like putative cysteine protease
MSERWKLAEGWSSFFLLLIMLVSAATSISAAQWTDGLGHLTTTALLGLIAGLLLAKSHFPALVAHLFSLVYGLFSVGYLVGGMIPLPTWRERIIELVERVATWLTKATSGGTSRDSLMFVFLLACLFWLLGYIAAWYTFRRPRLWRVLLPIGLTMLVNYYVYTDPRIATRSETSLGPFVAIFVMAALLYIVRTNVYMRELEWQEAQVSYSTELRYDFVRAGTLVATFALLAMVIAPGAGASPSIGEFWSGVTDLRESVRTTATRLFASLDTRGRGVGNPFGNRAILGGARDLGTEVLFDVRARSGRYWQAVVYDRYTGGQWINSDDHSLLLPPGENLTSNDFSMREEMTQTVAVYLPNFTQLFAAPEPLRVPAFSAKANISFDQGKVTSVSAVHSNKTLRAGSVYQIVSSISRADPDSLRQAGTAYPDFVQQRYLQLPDSVTPRTRELAREITAGAENSFDKARAIEQYLRENLSYDLSVPGPPDDQDFVDFVLFDLEAGYCDYYSSAFVVLARSVGIPSRLAMGYAQGEYDEDAKAYRVRANNGHSWPEVFFPEYGWIQFEPTVIIDPIDWPAPPSDSSASTAPLNPNSSSMYSPEDDRERMLPEEPDMPPGSVGLNPNAGSGGISPFMFALIGIVVAATLILAAGYWFTEKRGTGGLSLIERAYIRMWRFAAWLGVPAPPDQTPYERADALKTIVPQSETPINRITDLYVVERFGGGSGNETSSAAEEQWTLLRPQLWKSWLQKRLGRLQQEEYQSWEDFYKIYQTGSDGRNRSRSRQRD